MGIFEYIIVFMFSIGILLGGVGLLSFIIIYPICEYNLKKKSNKLQWKFIETTQSKVSNSDSYYGSLYYRILPSELSTFVKIFGSNNWIYYESIKFKSKDEFVKFAYKYNILDKLKTEDYWIEP